MPHEPVAMQTDDPKAADVRMREATIKRAYTLYSDQGKVQLMFEKVLSSSAAAKQWGIHKRNKKDGHPRILTEEDKKSS
ncbi:hypothetical protein VTP01DRAFT_3770 [Rhizomucor pusillus]|uniref:uncharacterized protein n=1 Tax=Rhizomucor pusillus TaxID=4840 RepID=UPI0037445A6E